MNAFHSRAKYGCNGFYWFLELTWKIWFRVSLIIVNTCTQSNMYCVFFFFSIQERMFQFWFNTFFVSQAAVTKEIYEDEPTLQIFEVDSDLRYFDVGKPDLDKAHKDDREKIYPSNFKVSTRLKTIFKWWLDMMTGQRNFCPVMSCFWPVKILGGKFSYL